MNCETVVIGEEDGKHVHRCRRCGTRYLSRYNEPRMFKATCRVHPQPQSPNAGPGTELTALFAALGITEREGCNCKGIAAEMDREGVAGCRRKRDYFLAQLNENARLYSWWDKLKAGSLAVLSGAPLTLGGLFDEAVARAEQKQPRLEYFSNAQRTIDTLSLVPRLPDDLAAVCGIARSGLAPAVEMAMALHLPLFTLSEAGVQNPGNGYRLSGQEQARGGPILLVDDSLGTGRSLRQALRIARRQWPDRQILTAVIYRNMLSKVGCDFWARELNEFHLFEWNLFNSPFFTGKIGYDFDGVLCRDGANRPSEALPLHLPRRDEIPLIVTGRHEHARAESDAWLARWRVRVRRMVMWTGGDLLAEDQGVLAVSRFKAEHYSAAGDLTLFVESDERQAREIAQLAGKAVVCPATGKVF